MRVVDDSTIIDAVKSLCIKANINLPADIKHAIDIAEAKETDRFPKEIMKIIKENYSYAETACVPICQDTGCASFYIKLGQDVHINGNLNSAINRGVSLAYTEGYLRKSMVEPLSRINTKDNTPAIINYDIVDGDKIEIIFAPKGFGSENMNRVAMLKPSDDQQGIINFVLNAVRDAGSKPCPPLVIGVGIGGNFERVALLSKLAMLRDINIRNTDRVYSNLENILLEKINKLGIGPQGSGGLTTALAVNIEHMPTHIAGLPVAISFGCHACRHAKIII